MKVTRVDKVRLLEIIEANKEKYVADLKEARKAYLIKAKADLAEASQNVTAFKSTFVHVEAPVDNTAQYDKIIQKLEMSVDEIIELNDQEFDQFVNNEWNFVRNLMMQTASYSN